MDQMAHVFLDAVVGEESWSRSLKRVAKTFGGFESHFMIWDRTESYIDFSAWGDFADRETESYSRCEALMRSRRGEVILTQKLPDKAFLQDEIYIDFLRPLGTRYIMGLKLVESDTKVAMLRVHRRAKRGPYADFDARRLGLLFPSFSCAAQIFLDQFQLKKAAVIASACLDRLNTGTMVIDRNLKVLHADCIARQALDQGASLAVRDGLLMLHPEAAHANLLRALDETAGGVGPHAADRAIFAVRAGDYNLGVSPFTEANSLAFRLPALDVFLVTLKRADQPSCNVLSQLKTTFGLTNAEVAIAEQIVRGQTPRQIAVENSISINTVKTHLKAVFLKIGVKSQSDLVRSVLSR